MALSSQFPNRIAMILVKGEILQKTSKRLCRADFHGFVIIRGIEDVSTMKHIFEKLIIEREMSCKIDRVSEVKVSHFKKNHFWSYKLILTRWETQGL
jgi:hypothetical protein